MPEFDSDGLSLHFELHGPDDGDPVVLVHGFCSNYRLNWVGSRWQETLTRAGRLVVGLDCRGHGRSAKPHDPAAYDRAEMAADVIRLLDHLGIARSDVIGYSMGGRIALELAVTRGDRLYRAVLGGVGAWAALGAGGHAGATARRLRGDTSVTDPLATMFHDFAVRVPGNDLEALAACSSGRQAALDPARMRAATTPVLVCAGDRDELAPGAADLATALGAGTHAVLEGRDHTTSVTSRAFKEAALEFLSART